MYARNLTTTENARVKAYVVQLCMTTYIDGSVLVQLKFAKTNCKWDSLTRIHTTSTNQYQYQPVPTGTSTNHCFPMPYLAYTRMTTVPSGSLPFEMIDIHHGGLFQSCGATHQLVEHPHQVPTKCVKGNQPERLDAAEQPGGTCQQAARQAAAETAG